jgi:hypothetical protein
MMAICHLEALAKSSLCLLKLGSNHLLSLAINLYIDS